MASRTKKLKQVHVYGPWAEILAGFMREKLPDMEFVTCTDKDELEACVSDVEVLLCQRPPKETLARADNLTWIMTMGAGVDTVLPNPHLREECTITNARGVHIPQIPEFVLGMILALGLGLPEHFRSQAESEWQMRMRRIITGQVVGIVGLGTIGREIARLADAIGLRVIGIKKNPEPVSYVEKVYETDELHTMLSKADFVVLIAALTPETTGMIGKAELAAMKPEAYLINVARGAMAVETDLIEALQNGTIAGAALDVFETEPLPPESPLWKMENVIITPHIAGVRPDYLNAVSELFCRNLENYLSGEPLFNIVDRDRCY